VTPWQEDAARRRIASNTVWLIAFQKLGEGESVEVRRQKLSEARPEERWLMQDGQCMNGCPSKMTHYHDDVCDSPHATRDEALHCPGPGLSVVDSGVP